MILYPTETLYALGVNALDEVGLRKLFVVKGREASKAASWLVRDVEDIAHFAVMSEAAQKLAALFLPGQLTLVLPVRDIVPNFACAEDRTVGFRISADPMAQTIVAAFMEQYGAPLTCASANVSGAPTLPTPTEILEQFGDEAALITDVHDDGPRKGLASTVVRVMEDEVRVLREGVIGEAELREVL